MKSTSPRKMAIILAFIASVLTGITIGVISKTETDYFLPVVLLAVLLVFFIMYLILYYFLNSFIFEKINPIYKTIHNVNIPEKELRKDLEKMDVIADVQDEVLLWAKNRTQEIAQLRQLEKYRREYIGNVSHELRTPIFNIQGYVLTLLDGGLEDPLINRLYLQRAEKSVNRMISIVNDLESISRLESGELKLDIKKFDIVTLFEEVFELHEMMAKEHNIKLKFSRSAEEPIFILADKKRILEAINNLIVNSIKYGKSHGKTMVDFLDMGENILVEISDNGIGISEKDLPRVFERFYRTDKSRSREMGGTGLGLSIVKHIIEAHNQTINVRSQADKGTSFAFTLKKA
ncbi:MAG: sensor histidine kinase [Bacteroidales bacterium]|nr:sensor histidine kinase [Bacteroidales bacterium]